MAWKLVPVLPTEEMEDIGESLLDIGSGASTVFVEMCRKAPSPWIPVSERLPTEEDGEVLVVMRDGRLEFAWATYWRGASNGFAGWVFRIVDEDEAPTHWMPMIPGPGESE